MKIVKGTKIYDAYECNDYRELVSRTTEKYPNNIAYKFKKFKTEENFEYINKTYLEFSQEIKYMATTLMNLELVNKKVAVIGDNSYFWCVGYLAVTTADMTIVPFDKLLPANELESLIMRSEVEAIIFDKKHEEVIKKIKNSEKTNLKYLITMSESDEVEILSQQKMINDGEKIYESGDKRYDDIVLDRNKISIMLFTSGTTNLPKAVMLTQANVCANISGAASVVKLNPTDTLLSFLPIHHTFECTITFLYGIYAGSTVAFCDGLKHIVDNLKEYEITIFVAVPLVLETMYKKILKGIEDKGKTKIINKMIKLSNTLLKMGIDIRKKVFKQILDNFGGKLRLVFYGAAPMNKDTIIGFNNFGIELVQGYGLTETSPVISAESDKEKRPGSVGKLLYHTQGMISEPNEEGIGEVIVKGPSVMKGYSGDKEKTEEVLKDGWFYTGDYGYFDEDDFLYITGRKKDVIVLKNGKNVYPQEIEFLINKLPYVLESIVYAREKDATDTLLASKIVYDKDLIKEKFGELTEEEYKAKVWEEIKEMNKNLSIDKKIKQIELRIKPFEKTTTQKVKRFAEISE